MIRRMLHAIKNRKPKQRSRLSRYSSRAASAIGIAYVLLLFFPNPLFAHTAQVGQFTIHSDRPIPAQIESVIEKATAKLKTSPFYTPEDAFSVYIAEDNWRRTLFMPHARGAYGVSMIFTGNTVLNRCEIANDLCTNDQPKFNRREMHAVLAHECMHHLMAGELGMISYFRLPTWKNEGYCEYVAGSPSFDELRGAELIRNGKSHGSHAFRYLTYLLAVRSCIDDQGMEPRQFLFESVDFQTALDSSIR